MTAIILTSLRCVFLFLFEQLAEENVRLKEKLREQEKEIEKLRDHQLVLQHQLEVYREDFRKERSEREQNHQKYSRIEEELNLYKSNAQVDWTLVSRALWGLYQNLASDCRSVSDVSHSFWIRVNQSALVFMDSNCVPIIVWLSIWKSPNYHLFLIISIRYACKQIQISSYLLREALL